MKWLAKLWKWWRANDKKELDIYTTQW